MSSRGKTGGNRGHEERSRAAKKGAEHKNPEERSESARKASHSQSHEEKSRAGKIGGEHSHRRSE